ncbi:hypothetical protein L484_000810 [Morus notabilis]|uniref:Uncharacterized protein n=1 Tax=Morus notabilis TaxID=981085 RepID=W9R4A7_9ROSA|nr:hypothetical protein L484_000810 [Morus notabilis]
MARKRGFNEAMEEGGRKAKNYVTFSKRRRPSICATITTPKSPSSSSLRLEIILLSATLPSTTFSVVISAAK